MNVLRHQDVSPELKTEFRARLFERLAKPRTRPVAAEECIVTIAGKRELARLAGLMVAHAALFRCSSCLSRDRRFACRPGYSPVASAARGDACGASARPS